MKLPVIPTILVGAAIATMFALGFWQLDRKAEKEALLARYAQASDLPPVAWPGTPDIALLYRRATGFCLEPVGWRATAGQNRSGESGWSHIVSCRTGGGEGPGMQIDMGWSQSSDPPQGWRGGEVSGVIAPDGAHVIRLIAGTPAPGLEASAAPSPDSIPNNHLLYAIQWFFFALAAGVIYVLALRKRRGGADVAHAGADR